MMGIRVLIVEDEPLLAEAHRTYTERVPGFTAVGVVHTARDAMAALRSQEGIDLVLLDFRLPDLHGLEVCRALRAAGSGTDVLAVTSARDLAMVRAAVALGVTHYLLKPFTFAAFRDKLERYAEYRRQALAEGEVAAQHEVDRIFATLRGTAPATLPKGLGAETLDAVLAALRAQPGLSAAEVATRTGTSRVTARRYLEHLVDVGRVFRTPRYGSPGRPEVEYRPVQERIQPWPAATAPPISRRRP
jgi:response regulator of citrate/malate metabolism